MSLLPPPPTSDPQTLEFVQERWSRLITGSAIYNFLLSPLKITHASRGRVLGRLLLSREHMNSKSGLHGAVSATIVDALGGLAISSWDLREKTGASVDINVSYLGTVGVGEEVEVEGNAERVGGSLAFTTVKISKVITGEVVVLGRHTKFVRQR